MRVYMSERRTFLQEAILEYHLENDVKNFGFGQGVRTRKHLTKSRNIFGKSNLEISNLEISNHRLINYKSVRQFSQKHLTNPSNLEFTHAKFLL